MENNYNNMKNNKKWRINKRKVMFVFIIPLIIAGIIFSVVTYINTKRDDVSNISFQGPVVGLSYRFVGHKAVAPVAAPAPVSIKFL